MKTSLVKLKLKNKYIKIVSKVCEGNLKSERNGHLFVDEMIAFIQSRSVSINDKIRCPGDKPKTWEFRKGEFVFYFTLTQQLETLLSVERVASAKLIFNNNFISGIFPDPHGYVYFLKSQFGFKIGMSNKISRRIKEFEVKLPFEVELHSFCKLDEYKKLEKELHAALESKNINGEWFSLSEEDWILIDEIVKTYNTKRFTEFVYESL